MKRWVDITAFVYCTVAGIFFFVTKIVTSHFRANECETDDDCYGADSVCRIGICICDIHYFVHVDKCDPAGVPVADTLGIITFILLLLSATWCIAACVVYDREH